MARYSFLGKDPFLVLRQRQGRTIVDRSGVTTESDEPFVPALRKLMAEFQSPFVPGLPRFTGGAVGFLAYDASPVFEPALEPTWQQAPWHALGEPAEDEAGFMLFDTVLAFDHVKHRILIVANARVTADDDLQALYQFACAKIQFLERELERGLSHAEQGTRPAAGVRLEHAARPVRVGRSDDQGAHRRRRHLPGRAVAAVRGRRARGPVHRLPRAAPRQPVAVHVLHADGRPLDRRIVAGDARARGRPARRDPPDRRHAAAGGERGGGPAHGRGAEAQREGARRARHARGPRPQRPRPGVRVRVGPRAAVHGARTLLARDAPGLDGGRPPRRRPRLPGRPRGVLSGRHGVGRAENPRDGDPVAAGADPPRHLRRGGRVHRLRRQPRFLHRDPHHHDPQRPRARAGGRRHRRPIRTPPPSTEETRDKARALLQALAMAETGL